MGWSALLDGLIIPLLDGFVCDTGWVIALLDVSITVTALLDGFISVTGWVGERYLMGELVFLD